MRKHRKAKEEINNCNNKIRYHIYTKDFNYNFLMLTSKNTHTHLSLLVTQLCLTLCDPMDCSPPGSSVHGIFQARIMEWVAISFSGGSSWPRERVSWLLCIGRRILYLSHVGSHVYMYQNSDFFLSLSLFAFCIRVSVPSDLLISVVFYTHLDSCVSSQGFHFLLIFYSVS